MKPCPYCAESIQDGAIKCRFCGSDLLDGPRARFCPFCSAIVPRAAKVCPACGDDISSTASTPPNPGPVAAPAPSSPGGVVAVAGVVIVFGLLVVGWAFGVFSVTDRAGRVVLPRSVGSAPVITRAEFNQITEGMSYEQVQAIIGAPGDLLSSSDVAGFKTVMYSWTNSNGSNMNAMFQNAKLIQKAQFGLPED